MGKTALSFSIVALLMCSGCLATFSSGYDEDPVVVNPYYDGPYWIDNGWYYYYNGGFYLRYGGVYHFHHFVPPHHRPHFDRRWQGNYNNRPRPVHPGPRHPPIHRPSHPRHR